LNLADNSEKLLEYLSRSHFLPSFNLPIDAVPFIARGMQNGEEKIIARMSDGLEKALVGYAPGKELTYKKQDFIVGGIYLEYMPRKEIADGTDSLAAARIRMEEVLNRTRHWFTIPKNILYFHMCKNCKHTLPCTEEVPSEVPDVNKKCNVCKAEDKWLSLPMIRPPGFAPLIRQREDRPNFAEVDDPNFSSDTNKFHFKTRWPTSLITNESQQKKLSLVDGRVELFYHQKIQILDVNAGMNQIEEEEGLMGFAFCKDCGHMSPNRIKSDHLRPYAITYEDGRFAGVFQHDTLKEQFNTKRARKCSSANKEINGIDRLLLGRLFTTNVLSLKIKWDEKWVDLQEKDGRIIGRRGAMTLCQALLQSICDADTGLAISPNDLGGDIRQTEDQEGFEIFIYEKVDGGAGLLVDIFEQIERDWNGVNDRGTIFNKVKQILSGQTCIRKSNAFKDNISRKISHPCEHICSGCLQDFSTQHIAGELNRESGFQFMELSLNPTETSFNHHHAANHLNFLAEEIKSSSNLEITYRPREAPTVKKFTILDSEPELTEPDDIKAQVAWHAVEINSKLLKIKPELTVGENSAFTAMEVIQDPIATKKRVEALIQPEDDYDSIDI
jgi:hypothetical protein